MNATINVGAAQAQTTIFGGDSLQQCWHQPRMLGSNELLAELERLRDAGDTSNAELEKLLKLPSSRVSEIFSRKRKITIDEMKTLVEHFGLEHIASAPSAEILEPLLERLLPDSVRGQSVRAVAEALSYGLRLLRDRAAKQGVPDAVTVAARAVEERFRDLGSSKPLGS